MGYEDVALQRLRELAARRLGAQVREVLLWYLRASLPVAEYRDGGDVAELEHVRWETPARLRTWCGVPARTAASVRASSAVRRGLRARDGYIAWPHAHPATLGDSMRASTIMLLGSLAATMPEESRAGDQRSAQGSVGLTLLKAASLIENAQHHDSLRILETVTSTMPKERATCAVLRGLALESLHQDVRAYEAYHEALNAVADFPPALRRLGVSAYRMGDRVRALDYLLQYNKAAPGGREAYFYLAQLGVVGEPEYDAVLGFAALQPLTAGESKSLFDRLSSSRKAGVQRRVPKSTHQ